MFPFRSLLYILARKFLFSSLCLILCVGNCVLGQVWHLMVSIPDLCLLPYLPWDRNILIYIEVYIGILVSTISRWIVDKLDGMSAALMSFWPSNEFLDSVYAFLRTTCMDGRHYVLPMSVWFLALLCSFAWNLSSIIGWTSSVDSVLSGFWRSINPFNRFYR